MIGAVRFASAGHSRARRRSNPSAGKHVKVLASTVLGTARLAEPGPGVHCYAALRGVMGEVPVCDLRHFQTSPTTNFYYPNYTHDDLLPKGEGRRNG